MENQTSSAIAGPGSARSEDDAASASASASNPNPMQAWWEGIARARSRIHALSAIVGSSPSLDSLADSDRPAKALLDSPDVSSAVSSALSAPLSGAGDNPLCQWLYETFQTSDSDLHLVVLRYIPLLAGTYLSRVVSASREEPLAGFEAVLLSLYAAETKARAGKPLLVNVPDLSYPSLYHAPRNPPPTTNPKLGVTPPTPPPVVGVLSPPLEPQNAVKSTKRAGIVAVALDWYYRKISLMPAASKVEFCEYLIGWAGQSCPCMHDFDRDDATSLRLTTFSEEEPVDSECSEPAVEDELGKMSIKDGSSCNGSVVENKLSIVIAGAVISVSNVRGARIPLPWELVQPILRILGHCLLAPLNPQEVRDAASIAIRCLYARATHDLFPQVIIPTRSLIQLDRSTRLAAMAVASSNSNVNTPTKPKKPEILLVSK
ncbi:Hyccin [Nymphaea thermarum]|nr:Hyccin [Nymphaea thermarum]